MMVFGVVFFKFHSKECCNYFAVPCYGDNSPSLLVKIDIFKAQCFKILLLKFIVISGF